MQRIARRRRERLLCRGVVAAACLLLLLPVLQSLHLWQQWGEAAETDRERLQRRLREGALVAAQPVAAHMPRVVAPRPTVVAPRAESPVEAGAARSVKGDGLDPASAAGRQTAKVATPSRLQTPKVSSRLHAFYYPWYGSYPHDGRWSHWNHEQMAHWDKKVARKYPRGVHRCVREQHGGLVCGRCPALPFTRPRTKKSAAM